MKVIAESSSTRTEWAIVDGLQIVERASTSGLNPYFNSRREISHAIRLELPPAFFKKRWEHVYFYGAGCGTDDKKKLVGASLVAQFKTPVTVESDLLGAARGVYIHNAGLVCILSTGANSCMYDGIEITKHVRPGGFILGDEGSNAYIGRKLVSDILKGLAPEHIVDAFMEHFQTDADAIMDKVYSHPHANRTLAEFSLFLSDKLEDVYAHELIYNSFMDFFRRNIVFYDYKSQPLSVVGPTGCVYRPILEQVAADFGATIHKIIPGPLPGLVEYHADTL